MLKKIVLISLFLASCLGKAQHQLEVWVMQNNTAVSSAEVLLLPVKEKKLSNQKGKVEFDVERGDYQLVVSKEGFAEYTRKLSINQDIVIRATLDSINEKVVLQDIFVTAKESKGMGTSSVLKREAIDLLQPSSFADLMSLLPGETSSEPQLTYSNHLKLREVGVSSEDYDTSSLGVLFTIDGAPINSNADMQETVGGDIYITDGNVAANEYRKNTLAGVDMRSIATDDIEQVEVLRGIPSVRYGNLSSGMVKIKRKIGFTPWKARVKVDGFSKLFYAGKGFSFPEKQMKLNVGVDYLDAVQDPRNEFVNYKRYTVSLRGEKIFNFKKFDLIWNSNLDYTGTFDSEKTNPDATVDQYESYKSTYNSFQFSNRLNFDLKNAFVKKIGFNSSIKQSYDKIEQTRWVQLDSSTPLFTSTEEGEFYGIYSDPYYVSDLLIDGKPLDMFLDIWGESKFDFADISHNLLYGGNYSYSKNNGRGQVYDIEHPPGGGMSTRPRAYNDIPAYQMLSFYAEDGIEKRFNQFKIRLNAGLRTNAMTGLSSDYLINNKWYLDPRVHLKIDFPKIKMSNDRNVQIDLTAAWGKNSKFPTLLMLHPQDSYNDFEQLNYYHNNPAYRQLHYKTIISSNVNYNLQPATNIKKEIRLGFSYNKNNLSVTYFDEKMDDGFRNMYDYENYTYKSYDTSGIDHDNITAAPLVEDLPYEEVSVNVLRTQTTNGSFIHKRGIEFQLSSRRFNLLNTRFTFNGAWLKTYYRNSLPFYKFISPSYINGEKQYILGLYDDEEAYHRESFNTSFTTDTYLPQLGLTAAFTADFKWYYYKRSLPQSGTPTHYVDNDGVLHTYGETEMNDAILQYLDLGYNANSYVSYRTPFSAHLHLKISKDFREKYRISMFVNQLFNFYKKQYVNGTYLERRASELPYFGMEMNIKL